MVKSVNVVPGHIWMFGDEEESIQRVVALIKANAPSDWIEQAINEELNDFVPRLSPTAFGIKIQEHINHLSATAESYV